MNEFISARGKGMGYISQRKGGQFVGRVTVNGKPYSFYGKSYKEAEKKLNEFLRSFNTTGFQKRKVYVTEYINEWLITFKLKNLRPSSYDRLERTFVCHIKNSNLKRRQMGNVRPIDIQNLIDEKAKTLSYSSVKKIYQLLNTCFKHAVISKDIEISPMNGVFLPKESSLPKKTKEISAFTKNEIDNLWKLYLNYEDEKKSYRQWIPLYILIAHSGLRIGEALALTWDNIDFDKRTISVKQSISTIVNRDNEETKTKNIIGDVKTTKGNRIIPLNQTAITMLKYLKENQCENNIVSEYIAATKTGQPVSHSSISKNFTKTQKDANIPHRGLHSLRHYFATELINAGIDVKVASKLLGHSSISVTYNFYVHPSAEQELAAVKKLDNYHYLVS